MATFSVDIPDDELERVTRAICAAYGYDPLTSSVTPDVFARQSLIAYIQGLVVNQDYQAARAAALSSIVVTPPSVS